MEIFLTPEALSSFAVLTLLEIVLGIDNLVFISILSERLQGQERKMAQRLGLGFALFTRLLFLWTLAWIAHLHTPLFTVGNLTISWRSIIMIVGGLFLLIKGTLEIHRKVEHSLDKTDSPKKMPVTILSVIAQIAVMDIVFSIDSIVTAIGMAKHVEIMIAAVVVSMIIMVLAVNQVSNFINNHPTIKMLALSFLLLIGMSLVAEGFAFEIPKGYIYFAMFFSLFVEIINIWVQSKHASPQDGSHDTRHPEEKKP
ncbi:MAG: TerC family protein [Alphaproteobacteria bacterium]|nr:TerC family protein [Alphaproteobacteria bacterium]